MTEPTGELEQLLAACVSTAGDREDEQVVDLREGADRWVREHTVDRAHTLLRTALEQMVALGASDLHLKAGSRPWLRVEGHLQVAPMWVLDAADCEGVVQAAVPIRHAPSFARTGEADFALDADDLGRFRVNAFRERGRGGLAVRRIATSVPSADELGLLPSVRRLVFQRAGLVLVGGRAGSGRSTTLAWMVDEINRTRAANIVTIEDPIEHLHADVRSIVHQREVGEDTASHAEGVRRALRQDPDVVVVGEIRDEDTALAALGGAQTGHLVCATIDAGSAAETVDRLIDLFPGARRSQARRSLAASLHAVVGQRLVTRRADRRRVLVQEVVVTTPRIARAIAEPTGAGSPLADLVAADERPGTTTFDRHLLDLCLDGTLSRDEAVAAATFPRDLAVRIEASVPARQVGRPAQGRVRSAHRRRRRRPPDR